MGLFLQKIGLEATTKDRLLMDAIDNSYRSLDVVGRGTLIIDPKEAARDPEFKHYREMAKTIVNKYQSEGKKHK